MHLDHAETFPERHTYSAGPHRPDGSRRALRIGLGGPVGSGKTATVAFTSLKTEGGVKQVADWVRERLTDWTAGPA